MGHFGIGAYPVFWGFMAAVAEGVGSALLVLGIATRPAAALVAFTMLVAATHHLNLPAGEPGSGLKGAFHALELLAAAACLLLTGPGRFSLSALARRSKP
jgi:putative oxidoreductase